MKEEIEKILALDLSGTSKLILIYFKLNGEGCISLPELSEKLNCNVASLSRTIKKLSEMKHLEVDNKTYKKSCYKLTLENSMNECEECGKAVSTSLDNDCVESTNGIFCDNKCFAKHVLMDDQFKEIYPEG